MLWTEESREMATAETVHVNVVCLRKTVFLLCGKGRVLLFVLDVGEMQARQTRVLLATLLAVVFSRGSPGMIYLVC